MRQVTRMLMKRDGITLPMLALRLGVSRTAIANRLGGPAPFSGKKPFTVTEVGTLAELFDAPPAIFLAGPSVLIGAAALRADEDKIAPGSIKKLQAHGVSGTRPAGRLSLVAA